MARKERDKIQEQDITGLKYFDRLAPLLERLHDVGCGRDRAGNRELHYDQYCLLVLLYLFNPIVTSLRGIQQASELAKVQKKLGCPRASLGSLSEAANVFDAERLKEIIAELGAELEPLVADPRLKDIPHALTLVDGTLLTVLPQMMQASWLKSQTGSGLVKWRLHTHFEVDRHIPTRIDVTPDGGGEHDERAVLERTIEADKLYVMDRGFAKFALFNRVVAAKSSYVCRLRDNSAYEVIEGRTLTPADVAAGVLSDQIVRLYQREGQCPARSSDPAGLRAHHAPHQPWQVPRRLHGSGQRWHLADRHQSLGCPRRDRRVDLSFPLDHRDFLPVLQARAGLPAPAQPPPQRHRDSDLLCDHRLLADQPLDGAQADAADLRDDLLLFQRSGQRSGTPGAPDEAQTPRGRTNQTLSHVDSATTHRARESLHAAP